MLEWGQDADRGNLLGVQPWMTEADYASEEAFSDRLSRYLEVAGHRGWLNAHTIVVWPEFLGTWLIATAEGWPVDRARSLQGAMLGLMLRHSVRFVRALLSASGEDRIIASLFRLKAERMAHLYQSVFSRLAQNFGVTMVAGSTILPDPHICGGCVVAGDGPLHSVSVVYGPDGRAHADLVRKAFPTSAELPFVAPASPVDLPIFDTPAGRLGVLVCADSWYPVSYGHLKANGVELIAVPSYVAEKGAWDKPWKGYDGAATPQDVTRHDVGVLTEGEAWRRYALAGRIADSGARAGINVFLAGSLWDLGAEGRSLMVAAGQTPIEAEGGRAAMLNLWL